MRSSSKVLIGLGIAALAAFALEVASPYVAMHRLQKALLAGDEEEIRDRVDFVKVREAMREDAAARTLDASREKTENGDAAAARAAGPGGAGTGRLIDAYATPKGLAEIARTGKNPLAEGYAVARSSWDDAAPADVEKARHREVQLFEERRETELDANDSAGPQGRGKDAPALTWRLRWRKWSQCVVELRSPTEIGGLNLYLHRSGLFSWAVERLASVEKPKRPTEAEVLKALGCEYDRPADKTALCRLPPWYVPYYEYDKFQPGGLVRTEVFGAYEGLAGDSAKLLVLVFSIPSGVEPWGALADSYVVGAVQYQLVGARWRMESTNLAAMLAGFGSPPPKVRFVEAGRGRQGWTMESEAGAGDSASLLLLAGGRIQEVWKMFYYRGQRSCSDHWLYDSWMKWRFDTASGGEYFDIVVEHGAESCENSKTNEKKTESPPWTERWKFVGDEYKSTNPRFHPSWSREGGHGVLEARRTLRDSSILAWESNQGGYAALRHSAKTVAASRRALEINAKDARSREWAETQMDLGDALSDLASMGMPESARLLREAPEAYRHALEVWTKDAQPQRWAYAQGGLGETLCALADGVNGADSVRLLRAAADAYRHPLEVWSKGAQPQEWAFAQSRLGDILSILEEKAGGAESARLSAEAVGAYRRAQEVWTKDTQPQDWATMQDRLGNALSGQARQAVGAESARLFAEAADAYRHELEVRNEEFHEWDWAIAQHGLGLALARHARLTEGAESARLWSEAASAFRHALKIMWPQDSKARGADGAQEQFLLGWSLSCQAELTDGVGSARLLDEAVVAYRHTLEVLTKDGDPQNWAIVQEQLRRALSLRANQRPRKPSDCAAGGATQR